MSGFMVKSVTHGTQYLGADMKAYKPDSVPQSSRPLHGDDHFSGI